MPLPSSVSRWAMLPTIVTSSPSRIQTVPSPMTIIQWKLDHGSRSRRAGILVSIGRACASASMPGDLPTLEIVANEFAGSGRPKFERPGPGGIPSSVRDREPVESETYAHRFGSSPPLSIGVEEELLLVDERRQLAALSEAVLDSVPEPFGRRISSEIFSEQIELKTNVCHDADQVLEELRAARQAVRSCGFELMASGLHPTASEGEPKLVAKQRYDIVAKDLGKVLLRTPPCGLHVHVGIPDPDLAIRVANSFRIYLPALQALSANSPFREGIDSGHASARTSVVRSYPRFQVPRRFRDYQDFCRVSEQLMAAAGVDDYTYIWWDVRPHPNLGTVEVRALDVPTTAAASAAIAALIQAIAAKELEEPSAPGLYRESLEESYFQAASHGLEAEILLDSDDPEPAPLVIERMLDSSGPTAASSAQSRPSPSWSGSSAAGTGPTTSVASSGQSGMPGLLDDLVERTTSLTSISVAGGRTGSRRGSPRVDGVAPVFDQDVAPIPPRPVAQLDETEDQTGRAGDHQDQPDRVDVDVGDVEVGREVEDRPNHDEEYGCSNRHARLLPRWPQDRKPAERGRTIAFRSLSIWAEIRLPFGTDG